jgi:plastocyanin domain-containing protein
MVHRITYSLGFSLLLAALAATGPAKADDPDATITIQAGKFNPSELTLPSGKKLKIVVRNVDPSPSEFESVDFHREKVVQSGDQITVFVGPLDPGTYEFFDDFHPEDRGHLMIK